MGPLTAVAVGLAVVVLDLRTERFDVLLDPAGWALVVLGVHRLGLRRAAVVGVVVAACSAAEVSLPHRWEQVPVASGGHPGTVSAAEQLVFLHVDGWRLGALALAAAGAAVVVWLLAGELARQAAAAGRSRTAQALAVLRWAVPAAWSLPVLVGMVAGAASDRRGYDPVWNGDAELVALAGVLAVGALVALLLVEAREGWATARQPDPSPWAELVRQRDEAD